MTYRRATRVLWRWVWPEVVVVPSLGGAPVALGGLAAAAWSALGLDSTFDQIALDDVVRVRCTPGRESSEVSGALAMLLDAGLVEEVHRDARPHS